MFKDIERKSKSANPLLDKGKISPTKVAKSEAEKNSKADETLKFTMTLTMI